jgi:plasmid replication initiation protein
MSVQQYREQEQLILDFFVEADTENRKYSQSIELYDAIPKYHWGKVQRDSAGRLPIMMRTFKHKGFEYEVEVTPARLRNNGVEMDCYPGVREELVEDALRKIATDGRIRKGQSRYGIEFSINELQKELKTNRHSYSKTQIKDALEICNKTHIKLICKSNDDTIEMNQQLFPLLVLANRKQWETGKTRAIVEFNDLVTRSIEQRTFRHINYERSMRLSLSLARWLHKRMSHNYKQAASFKNTYSITLKTIIRDSGIGPYKRFRNSRTSVLNAIQELIQSDVIYKCDEETVREGRKLIDIKFTFTPSMKFSSEMRRANAKTNTIVR